ncbi:MAG: sigma-70 family RNA polymerase sigma factor [Defluviitaleaceae bacterium]|nr:sigma-70 family RNA polymerase sigma factor [Defluviitaleaceae bacterium]
MQKTDYELIRACLEGRQEFFEELVNRYKNLVYSIILRQLRNKDEANDLAQDVFLKMYKNLASYTPEFKFSTWIMRITSNHIIDAHRRKKFETISYEEYTENGGRTENTVLSPEEEYIRRDKASRINKIVAGLPEIYKTPVAMYHQQNMSYQEISEKTGEPLSKVKNRIFRGRKMLKALLAEEI